MEDKLKVYGLSNWCWNNIRVIAYSKEEALSKIINAKSKYEIIPRPEAEDIHLICSNAEKYIVEVDYIYEEEADI